MIRSNHKQQGAALFVGLIFLLVLTILGLTAARVSTLDERMAGNFLRQKITATATDDRLATAVKFVTERVDNPATAPPANSHVLLFNLSDCLDEVQADTTDGCKGETWWQALVSGVPAANMPIPASVHTVIENMTIASGQGDLQVGSVTYEDYWRITARSDVTGAQNRSVQVVRQTLFVP